MKYLVLILFAAIAIPLSGQTFDPDYLDGELYIKVEDTSSVTLAPLPNIPALVTILNQFGYDTIYSPFVTQDPVIQRIYRMEFTDINSTNLLITQLEALTFIEYAEQVPLIETTGTNYLPNDLQAQQWFLPKINAPLAWDVSRGDTNVTVAIVDNAVSTTHEDLADVIWTNPNEIPNNFLDDDLNGYPDDVHGYDVANQDNNTNPPASAPATSAWNHGTHCAGIAGASSDNGVGIASIGFNIRIIPVKASLDATGGNTLERAYEGVDYAVAAGADIISMSWGSRGNSATGNLIMTMAMGRGAILIGAAGNNNSTDLFYPAAYSDVIAVGATDQADLKSGFSNYGAWIDVMAPGSSIYATFSDSTNMAYGSQSGTSMACPLVAGLAGLLLSAEPTLTPAQMKTALEDGCEDIDLLNPTYVGQLGAGRINAYNSMLSLGLVGIEEELRQELEGINLYPNPVSNHLFIDGPDNGYQVEIYNLSGKLIQSFSVSSIARGLDISRLDSGAYLARVWRDNVHVTKKILKI